MRGDNNRKATSPNFRRKRSKILYQITLLLVIVVVATGLATFFIYRGTQNNLIDKSTEKCVNAVADNVSTSTGYVSDYLYPIFAEKIREVPAEERIEAYLNRQLNEAQKFLDNELRKIVDAGLLGLDMILYIAAPTQLNPEALVIASSDESLVFNWEVPEYLSQPVEEGSAAVFVPSADTSDDESEDSVPEFTGSVRMIRDGVPELGLEGAHLISMGIGVDVATSIPFGAVAMRPVQEEIDDINAFGNEERSNTNLFLGIVVVISIIVVIIISFFVLSFLIHKRITEPIDELSAAAEQVMQGNLEVEIPIRKGEEFAGLKRAFKEMVVSFRSLVARSVGEDEAPNIVEERSREEASPQYRTSRSSILYQITLLLVIVFMVSGLATFFIIRESQNRLIERSTDKLVQIDVESAIESSDYIAQVLYPAFQERIGQMTEMDFMTAVSNEELTEAHIYMNEELSKAAEREIVGMNEYIYILPPSTLNPEPVVFAASDESLVYEWEVPDYLAEAVEKGADSSWILDGVSELGLEGEHAVILTMVGDPANGIYYGAVSIKNLADVYADTQAFFEEERRNINLLLGLVIACSIIVVIIISFFVLRYLIRKRITEPVDELAAAAEQVMQGNLDVEIPIRKGEEFEGLKRAFQEMIDNMRRLLARSTEED